MDEMTYDLTFNRTDSIETIIEKGERQGFIVLPWRASKMAIKAKNAWYLNRRKLNKPYIIVYIGINGRGVIRVDGDSSDGFCGLEMNSKELMNETQEIYGSFPKERIKKMRLKASNVRAIYSRDRAFAYFPPGDTSIIECVLRHAKKELQTNKNGGAA